MAIGGATIPPKAFVNIWRFEIVYRVDPRRSIGDKLSPFDFIRIADAKHNERLIINSKEVHRTRNLIVEAEMHIGRMI
jgi:hypothetical protein